MDPSRLTAPFTAAVERVTPGLKYAGVWRYSVVACDFANQTISGNPLNTDMPPLVNVPMAIPGIKLNLKPGAIVLIGFAENNPTLPYVAQYPQDVSQILTMQLHGGVLPNARQGDTVSVTITPATIAAMVLSNSGGPVTATTPANVTGTITSGSAEVFS